MANINDLIRERNKIREESKAVLDSALAEGRALSDEERANDEARFDRIMELGDQIQRMERVREQERLMPEPTDPVEPEVQPEPEQRHQPIDDGFPFPEYRAEFQQRLGEVSEAEYADAFRSYLATGKASRALSQGIDTEGGYTVFPQFAAQLIQAKDDALFLRRFSNVIPVRVGESLGVPSLDADPADPDWTSELATGSVDSTMAFGKRELRPHPLAKRIKMSKTLARNSALGIEGIIRQRLAYKHAVAEEKAFLTGSGAGRPLGVFTASADGISTSRDVSTGNTTTSITFDGLKEAKWTLKFNYHAAALWIFHRDAGKQIDKLKDGEGRYIWEMSTQIGEPDRLLGIPVYFSEFAPNTFTAGLYTGILGDFSMYWIADSLSASIEVLRELYAETNQLGYISRAEVDGMPVLEEAFIRVKLAT